MSARTSLVATKLLTLFAVGFGGPAQALQTTVLSATVDGDAVGIQLYRPDGHGPFPLLVLSHGSPRNAADRATYGLNVMHDQANALAGRGIAVAVVLRRGYGGSGRWAENYGGCAHPDYFTAGLASAKDVEAAVATLVKQPGIDGKRIALMGVSAGGWASVAAGSQLRVAGVVNFAGGRGSRGPDDVCDEPALVSAMSRYGASSRSPEMWIYSVNDRFFGPALAHRLHDAFTSTGGRATFVTAPAYRDDGHGYINNIQAWMPQVTTFLHTVGFLP